MLKFIDDEDLTDSERLELDHILNNIKNDPKCFFMDDPSSVAALQRYEKIHGHKTMAYTPSPMPVLKSTNQIAQPTYSNSNSIDVQYLQPQHHPTATILPGPPINAAAAFGAMGMAQYFLAPHATGPAAHVQPHPHHQGQFVFASQPSGAPGAFFYPAYYLPQPHANPADILAFQQAARNVIDSRAHAHLAAVQSAAVAASMNMPIVAELTPSSGHGAAALAASSAAKVQSTADNNDENAAATNDENTLQQQQQRESIIQRDMVPVDPEPIHQHNAMLQQQLAASQTTTTFIKQQNVEAACDTVNVDDNIGLQREADYLPKEKWAAEPSDNVEVESINTENVDVEKQSFTIETETTIEPDTVQNDEDQMKTGVEENAEIIVSPKKEITVALKTETAAQLSPVKPVDRKSVSPVKKTLSPDGKQSAAASAGPAVAPPPRSSKSWASLFKDTRTATNAIVLHRLMVDDDDETADGSVEMRQAIERSLSDTKAASGVGQSGADAAVCAPRSPNSDKVAVTTVDRDPPAQKLGKQLLCYKLEHRGPNFQLRGLKNFGNWCYINATLQALMVCPPFVHLLRNLKQHLELRTPSSTPMLDALVKFVGEFSGDRYYAGNKGDDKFGSFEPSYVYKVLSSLRDDTAFSGRQEDAEEFLSLVLNHLHEEMAACVAYSTESSTALPNGDLQRSTSHSNNQTFNNAQTNNEANEWRQVVPGRRLAVTRTSKLAHSPISEIFSGVLRNGFQQSTSKESVSLESFFTLQLTVQVNEVTSLTSALQQSGKEIFIRKDPNRKTEGEITRRTTFQELPIVLILHLKYFVYADGAPKKHLKQITYGMDLQIDRSLTVPQSINPSISSRMSRSYKLFAVVFHHGEQAEGGHYTADIFHGGQWVSMDDGKFETVNEAHVLDYAPPRVPYLLFYRRCDVFSDQQRNFQQQQATAGRNNN